MDTALHDIAAAIESIERSTAGMDCDDFREAPDNNRSSGMSATRDWRGGRSSWERRRKPLPWTVMARHSRHDELATEKARVELVVGRLENHPDRFTAVESRRAHAVDTRTAVVPPQG